MVMVMVYVQYHHYSNVIYEGNCPLNHKEYGKMT
jgi:hypothetical protein